MFLLVPAHPVVQSGPDLGGPMGPPTIEGPPTKLLIFFLANESADDFFIDVLLQFVSVTMYWNCSARRFCLPKYDFWRDLKGGAKKFTRLAIACHILLLPHKLWYNSTTAPDPVVSREGCPLAPIAHLSWRLWHLDPWRLRCLELGPPHFSDQSYAPG